MSRVKYDGLTIDRFWLVIDVCCCGCCSALVLSGQLMRSVVQTNRV